MFMSYGIVAKDAIVIMSVLQVKTQDCCETGGVSIQSFIRKCISNTCLQAGQYKVPSQEA